jgi:hypothetical protein
MSLCHNANAATDNCYQDYGVRNAADWQRLLLEEGAVEISSQRGTY